MTAGGVEGSEPGYRLAAAGREKAEDERLDLLERLFDPGSRSRRDLMQPGWRCLEIGAGRGSMAVWLAERVGPAGQVVATDIDTRYLARLDLPNLEVVQHNILDDPLDALGPGSFDLVCTRLVLFWLAGRQEQAVHQMTACLRPGGWLIDEEGDWGVPGPVDLSHPLYAGIPPRLQQRRLVGLAGLRPLLRAQAAHPVRALRPAQHQQPDHRQRGTRGNPLGALVAAEPRRHPRLGAGQRHHRNLRRRTSGADGALQRPVGLVHHRAPARLLGPATRLTNSAVTYPGPTTSHQTRTLETVKQQVKPNPSTIGWH